MRATIPGRGLAGVVGAVVVAALIALIVAGGAIAWLHTGAGRAWLLATVDDQLRGTGLALDAGRLTGSPLRRFVIEGIRLRAAQAPAGSAAAWIEIDELHVSWRPLALLRRTLRVESIELRGARVDQRSMPAFGANSTGGVQLPLPIEVAELVIADAMLVLTPAVSLDSLRVELNGRVSPIAGEPAVRVAIAALRGHWIERQLDLQSMRGTLELTSFREWATFEGGVAGELRWQASPAEFEVTGTAGRYRASLRATLPAGALGSVHAGLAEHPALRAVLAAAGGVDPRREPGHHLTLDIESEAGSLRLDSRLDGAAVDASFDLVGADPARWWPGLPDGECTMRGRIGLAQVTDPLSGGDVGLHVARSTIGRLTIDTADIAAHTRGDTIEVDSLEVEATATRLHARGRYGGLDDLDVTVAARCSDLSVWAHAIGQELAGSIEVDARIASDVGGLRGTADLRARDVDSGRWRASSIDADLEATGDGRRVLNLATDVSVGDLRAVGGAALERCGVRGDLRLAVPALGDTAADAPRGLAVRGLRGMVEAAIDSLPGLPQLAASTLVVEAGARFDDGHLSGHVRRLEIRESDGRDVLVLRAPLDVSIDAPDAVTLEGLDLALPSGVLRGNVLYAADSLATAVEIEDVALEELSRFVPGLPFDAGRVEAAVALRGAGGAVAGEMTAAITNLMIEGHGPGRIDLELALLGDSAALDLRLLAAGDDSIAVRGRIPIRLSTSAPHWAWSTSELDLQLAAAVDSMISWGLGRIADGTALVLDARISGPPRDVQIDLAGTVTPTAVKGFEDLAITIDLTSGAGRTQIAVEAVSDDISVLEGAAELPLLLDAVRGLALDGALPLTAHLETRGLELGRLAPYLGDRFVLSGSLDLDSEVGGTVDDPRFLGDLRLGGARIEVQPLALVLQDLEIEGAFSNERIIIRRGSGKTAQGTLQLDGSLPTALGADRSLDLRLSATGLAIQTEDIKRALADVDLALRGDVDAPELSGRIQVEGATLRLPDRRQRKYLELTDAEVTELTGAPVDSLATGGLAGGQPPRLDLDLKVEIPRAVFLRNNMLAVEIGGDLVLVSTDQRIELNGELKSIRGEVDFAGQRFDVRRGIVRFAGDMTPSIDIDATHDVQQWRIHVLVLGTARAPELSVYSDPPLPESDVLSLLLFGRRAGDLDADERYSLGERATTMLAGMATAPLEAALASQLGLDLLRIDTAGSGSSVTVGKYLGERAMLRIEQSLEQSTRRELTIEYSLTRKLRMDVSTDERGKSGADLFYEFDR